MQRYGPPGSRAAPRSSPGEPGLSEAKCGFLGCVTRGVTHGRPAKLSAVRWWCSCVWHSMAAAAVATPPVTAGPCSSLPRFRACLHAHMPAIHAVAMPPCPSSHRLENDAGIVARFVIGHSADAGKEAAVTAEASKHGDMLRLDLLEGYAGLPAKTIAFLRVRFPRVWLVTMPVLLRIADAGCVLCADRQRLLWVPHGMPTSAPPPLFFPPHPMPQAVTQQWNPQYIVKAGKSEPARVSLQVMEGRDVSADRLSMGAVAEPPLAPSRKALQQIQPPGPSAPLAPQTMTSIFGWIACPMRPASGRPCMQVRGRPGA